MRIENLKLLTIVILIVITSLSAAAQNSETEYQKSIVQATTQNDPSVARAQALAGYIDALTSKPDEEAKPLILRKLREMMDIDFYAVYLATIKSNYDAKKLNEICSLLPSDEWRDLKTVLQWHVANYNAEYAGQAQIPYPANMPPPGFGWGKTVSSNSTPKIAVVPPPAPIDPAIRSKIAQLVKASGEQMNNNNAASALRSLDECLTLNPNDGICHGLRGNIYIVTGEYDKAQTDLNEAIRLNPDYDGFYYMRGILYNKKKDSATAIRDLNKAIELAEGFKDRHPEYYSERASNYFNLSKLAEALADLNKAIELDPKNYSYYFQRGLVDYGLNDKPSAIADYRKALQLNPQFEQARKSLKLLGVEP